jgi:hypothetical protein
MKPFEYYSDNSEVYPDRREYTGVFVYDKGRLIWNGSLNDYSLVLESLKQNHPNYVMQKFVNEEAYKEQRTKYNVEEKRLRREFEEDLYEEFGVQNHPKRKKVFEMAWERGHSSGYSEVCFNFEELVELIKD